MIQSFRDQGTRDVAADERSKLARKLLPEQLVRSARAKMAVLNRATTLSDIANTPGYHLEKLGRDRKGQYSIRINRQYRICFVWDGEDAHNVEIVDYHG